MELHRIQTEQRRKWSRGKSALDGILRMAEKDRKNKCKRTVKKEIDKQGETWSYKQAFDQEQGGQIQFQQEQGGQIQFQHYITPK